MSSLVKAKLQVGPPNRCLDGGLWTGNVQNACSNPGGQQG